MILKSNSPVSEFSEAFTNDLEARILKAKTSGGRMIAAFDADGTLWDTDMGEIFFLYQINHCRLPNMPVDPWRHYVDLKAKDRIRAYSWLAQINDGQAISQVRSWAKAAIQDFEETHGPLPILKSMQRLIHFLQKNGAEIFVVTASVKWAVEPAAALLGIPFEHILGFQSELDQGVVSSRMIPPPTYRQGKADALMAATQGLAPILCAGNTLGDIALLKSSSNIKLAVRTQSLTTKENDLLNDELTLQKEASAQGWLHHAFRK